MKRYLAKSFSDFEPSQKGDKGTVEEPWGTRSLRRSLAVVQGLGSPLDCYTAVAFGGHPASPSPLCQERNHSTPGVLRAPLENRQFHPVPLTQCPISTYVIFKMTD